MNPEQASGMLANANQYLNQAVLKGVKGDFHPVNDWYQDIYANS